MGQRTAFLVKKNYKDNKSVINLIHHQWGIGKVTPMLFLHELIDMVYSLDRKHDYDFKNPILDYKLTF